MREYEINGEGVVSTTSASWRIFNNAICDDHAGTIIVLDALDECERSEFTLLVNNLSNTEENAAKFLLTSRPYGNVVSSLTRLVRRLIMLFTIAWIDSQSSMDSNMNSRKPCGQNSTRYRIELIFRFIWPSTIL